MAVVLSTWNEGKRWQSMNILQYTSSHLLWHYEASKAEWMNDLELIYIFLKDIAFCEFKENFSRRWISFSPSKGMSSKWHSLKKRKNCCGVLANLVFIFHSPQALVGTTHFMHGVYFALRSGQEPRGLRFQPPQNELIEKIGDRAFFKITQEGLRIAKVVIHNENIQYIIKL